ncbi:MAG TPA: CO dehydrogenase/acetyl-CoA synthase subunit delta [Bacillota bacterium]|jgi:acetyl-CoA decarbonylase/synthase complex subunit delta|nr:acetyl-CoA decarbonylase/synthase complex subunit delta [Bacillota bacterium]HOA35273.1 CO dehydrogenase/acetyl-CoA synthase subunit delta [Bacillota bacterium]HOJ83905.1 CO dehydrogenase/acetyl-CoA synthase subunit delta [Bacillota bacterium]HOL15900.1 CO dehydrogenase/acetyl-CoA synthase subunit delta [Bacillota bacterium]HPZ11297.1 CO dehydrogenase/acetyl-CoA synthase subunit delta [Bacillota bacterium]
MAVEIQREKYRSKVGEVVLGATKEQGGSRSHTITVGGESTLPFLHFEGDMPNRPVVALEILDMVPEEWHPCLEKYYGDVYADPADWAKKCVDEYGADLVQIRLSSADPDLKDSSPEDCAATVKKVLEAVGVPLIVIGCGKAEKDNLIYPVVAEAAAGENLLLGVAELENYKAITSACMAHQHNVIAQSPIDINICKQLNILIAEMSTAMAGRIIIDPTIAALGYGIEYTYSIMERARNGALQGDKMLAMPMIGNIGYETWRTKEANTPADEAPGWGEQEARGILWEATTAMAYLQSGMDILVMRHPRAAALVKQNIDELMQDNSY